jgi:spermidine synthase
MESDLEPRGDMPSPVPVPAFPGGNGGKARATDAVAAARPTPVHALGFRGWRFTPHVVVFFSAACIMVMELVAGRLIARHLGSSLYTWTSIIGVVLAGMSIGNYVGGRMADRFRPERFVGWLFLIASLTCLSTLVLNHFLAVKEPFEVFHWPTRVFASVLVVFMMPALILGTISPAMAKMALERSNKVGATIGSVYAWATVGSIVGTLATGFYLIAALGAQGVVLVVSLGLAVIGLCMGPHRWAHAAWIVAVVAVCFLAKSPSAMAADYGYRAGVREFGDYVFGADSDYQYVKVYEDTSGKQKHRTLRVLALDYLIHGYVDPKDPTYFEYDYERIYRDVARRLARGKGQVSTFFLGGGSYTFPRWVLHEWPGSRVEVAEIDPLVVEANHQALGLPRDTPIKTYVMDARNAIDDLPADRRFDLIFGDAFSDLSVPYHLTTLEFARKLKSHMAPDGAYLINIIDDWQYGFFLSAMYNTLRGVFKNVYVFCTEEEGITKGRETFVVAATDASMDTSDWLPGHEVEFSGSVLKREDLQDLAQKTKGRILTDDDAPVENLLEPVVRTRK